MTTAQNTTGENTVATTTGNDACMRFFDFKEEKLRDLGQHEDIFAAKANNTTANWILPEAQLRQFDQFITQELSKKTDSPHPAWFALNRNDELVCIGHFPSFLDADENASVEDYWIFSCESLRQFQKEIQRALGTASPEVV